MWYTVKKLFMELNFAPAFYRAPVPGDAGVSKGKTNTKKRECKDERI